MDAIIIEALAQLDSLMEPLRDSFASYWPAVWILRRNYALMGLPYRGRGSKDCERALRHLAKRRWVARKRTGSTKTTSLKLTHAGLIEAWRLTGIPADRAIIACHEIYTLGDGSRWVGEMRLVGKEWGPGCGKECLSVQRCNTPALSARWAESNCDGCGRVGYRLTKSGLLAVKKDLLAGGNDQDPSPVPVPEKAAVELYDATYEESINWLNSQTAASVGAAGDLGGVPLPISAWLEREVTGQNPDGSMWVAKPYVGT